MRKPSVNGKRSVLSSSRGESMVVALVLLFVFLLLGASVMTAAASTAAASSARVAERRLYYGARSTLDALDDSLRNGEIGDILRAAALTALGSSETASVPKTALNLTVAPPAGFSQLAIQNATLTFSGTIRKQTQDPDGNPAEAYLRLSGVTLAFDAEMGGKKQSVRVVYQYVGYRASAQAGHAWKGDWSVQQVGQ